MEYNSWVAIKVDTNYKNDYKIPEIKESIKIKLRDFLEIKEKKKEEDFDKIVSKAPAGTIITRHKIKRNEIEKYMSGNKKIFISMFIMISFTALCQNYRVMYDYSFVSDSTNINNIENEEMILDIHEEGSVFYSYKSINLIH